MLEQQPLVGEVQQDVKRRALVGVAQPQRLFAGLQQDLTLLLRQLAQGRWAQPLVLPAL
jgi:hypothetical protein